MKVLEDPTLLPENFVVVTLPVQDLCAYFLPERYKIAPVDPCLVGLEGHVC